MSFSAIEPVVPSMGVSAGFSSNRRSLFANADEWSASWSPTKHEASKRRRAASATIQRDQLLIQQDHALRNVRLRDDATDALVVLEVERAQPSEVGVRDRE